MHAIIIISILAILVLYLGLGSSTRAWVQPVSIAGLCICLGDLFYSWSRPATYFNEMLRDSHFSLSFSAVLIGSTLLLFLLSGGYFEKISEHIAEYHALMLFSLCGGIIMVSFQNMTMLFLGIEILSVSVYILAGIKKKDLLSNEASLKYFLMGAFFTAILLLGITFVYGATASFSLSRIAEVTHSWTLHNNLTNGLNNELTKGSNNTMTSNMHSYMLYAGVLLILLALSFKVSIAPFHFWTPDVYEGSPTLVTAFMSTVVKVAGFAAFLRLFENAFPSLGGTYETITRILIILTLLAANIAALRQNSIKRMLAWSSISHAGYMLIPMLVVARFPSDTSFLADNAVLIYSIAYCLASVSAFAVLISIEEKTGTENIEGFNGLAKRSPMLAFAMAVSMCSMAGIPLTFGFFGKFYIFKAALETHQQWVVLAGVIAAILGIYYYFKVIAAMYFEPSQDLNAIPSTEASISISKLSLKPSFSFVLIICTVLSLLLGILPSLFAGILI